MSRLRLFPVILVLLFVTFTLRLGDFVAELARGNTAPQLQSAEALANEPAKAKEGEKAPRGEIPAKSAEPPKEVEIKGVKEDNPFSDGYSDEEVKVLQSLSKRRDQLDNRERDIDQREKLLQAAEKKVDEKVAEMNSLKKQIEELLDKQDKMQDARVTQLVRIYESMKPKDAANIFNEMDNDVLLGIIDKMSERKVAPVLAAMNPDRARSISAQLAAQKALPKKAPQQKN